MDWPPEGTEINTLGYPKINAITLYLPDDTRENVKVCRCWRSKRFPYCDDTHKALQEAGDDVGPFIVRWKQPDKKGMMSSAAAQVRSFMQDNSNKPMMVAASVAVGFGIGVAARYKLHGGTTLKKDQYFITAQNNGNNLEQSFEKAASSSSSSFFGNRFFNNESDNNNASASSCEDNIFYRYAMLHFAICNLHVQLYNMMQRRREEDNHSKKEPPDNQPRRHPRNDI